MTGIPGLTRVVASQSLLLSFFLNKRFFSASASPTLFLLGLEVSLDSLNRHREISWTGELKLNNQNQAPQKVL
jgi:hypothetical protein